MICVFLGTLTAECAMKKKTCSYGNSSYKRGRRRLQLSRLIVLEATLRLCVKLYSCTLTCA